MLMLWIILGSLLVIVALLFVAFLILQNSMYDIGNAIVEHFEKDTANIDSIDELIIYHRECPIVDYII